MGFLRLIKGGKDDDSNKNWVPANKDEEIDAEILCLACPNKRDCTSCPSK